MCPEKQMLSVYFDDGLPSPWKEKMEAHLASCPQCAARLGEYKMASNLIKRSDNADEDVCFAQSKDRVWQKLEDRLGDRLSAKPSTALHFPPQRNFLARSVEIPLPFAAAAAAVLVLAISMILLQNNSQNPNQMATQITEEPISTPLIPAGFDLDDPRPAANMSEVLKYLESEDSSDIVIIKLPERKNFNGYGEPTMIKAADYSTKPQSEKKGR
jgi:hypothetical protein